MNKRMALLMSMIFAIGLMGCGGEKNVFSLYHNPIMVRLVNTNLSLDCESAYLTVQNALMPIARVLKNTKEWNGYMEEVQAHVRTVQDVLMTIAQVAEKTEKWNEHMEEVQAYVGKEENLTGESANPFFFPMSGEEATKTVYLEMRPYTQQFIGAATLHILQLQGIPGKGSYYKLYFTDYVGICEDHNEFYWNNDPFSPCHYFEKETYENALYFYVEEDRIYQLWIYSEDELKEGGSEPWKDTIYRLVCANEGTEETIDTSFKEYHEGVQVEGDERKYSYYPGEPSGSCEYQYITWKEGQGITSYVNWAGNNKMVLSFSDSDDIYGHGWADEETLMRFYYRIF